MQSQKQRPWDQQLTWRAKETKYISLNYNDLVWFICKSWMVYDTLWPDIWANHSITRKSEIEMQTSTFCILCNTNLDARISIYHVILIFVYSMIDWEFHNTVHISTYFWLAIPPLDLIYPMPCETLWWMPCLAAHRTMEYIMCARQGI